MSRIHHVAATFLLLSGEWWGSSLAGEHRLAKAEERIPFLTQRLNSKRWQVRYCLLGELNGRDAETKHLIERLVKDQDNRVANQALVRYLVTFVDVDKALFDPEIFTPGRHPLSELPKDNPRRALVEYCLGSRKIPARPKGRDHPVPTIPVLDVAKLVDPSMYEPLTIVGLLGNAEDAKALHPFLESTNDYVVVGTAKALLRLGDREKGAEALRRLTSKEVPEHLYYITEVLHALREIRDPRFEELVLGVLARVRKEEGIQPNWLGSFLLLAAEVKDDVWD